MASTQAHDRRSRAAIAGHPLHPMLVAFPIAFLVGALASDLAFWSSGDLFWARASLWLLGAGLVMGSLAAIAGLVDFLSIRAARVGAVGWVHFIGNAAAMLLALWNLLQRVNGGPTAILPGGVILSALVVVIFLVTGWLGGELVFRYRIAAIEPESAAPMRPARGANVDRPGSGRRSGTHG
jgi:uncharacterized membrane protein